MISLLAIVWLLNNPVFHFWVFQGMFHSRFVAMVLDPLIGMYTYIFHVDTHVHIVRV